MPKITEEVLQMIAGDIEDLLLEQWEGIAGIAPGEPDSLAIEIVARWNDKSHPSENLCERCRLMGPGCPARESAGNFAHALACLWYVPKLELVKNESNGSPPHPASKGDRRGKESNERLGQGFYVWIRVCGRRVAKGVRRTRIRTVAMRKRFKHEGFQASKGRSLRYGYDPQVRESKGHNMTGLVLHPLRIAALDRMKVLRVPMKAVMVSASFR